MVKLKGQICLGNDEFESEMQGKIGKVLDGWSIPKKQKCALAKLLLEIENHAVDRDSAILTAYVTGVYSQRVVAYILIYIQVQ